MKAQFYIKLWKLEGTNVNTTQTGNIQKQECQRKHLLKKNVRNYLPNTVEAML